MPDAVEITSRFQTDPAMDAVYERMSRVVPPMEWPFFAPVIAEINELKRLRNAVVLAHNYQAPQIFHGVADIVGDSLALAAKAVDTDADVIVLAGVHFMAETAKLLNPSKTVLIPDPKAGCSLAESITAEDIRGLRAKYPGVPVVAYVNTSAATKAEVDICCTSGNAVEVVRSLNAPRVLFLPDEFLAKNVQAQVPEVEIIPWTGHCEVHERFTGAQIREYRSRYDHLTVIAHPECPPDVVAESDFAGSTARMVEYVQANKPERVLLVTECSMSDNIATQSPETEFVRPCNLCPHMKRITLENIRDALRNMNPVVEIDPEIAARARISVERMLAVKPR